MSRTSLDNDRMDEHQLAKIQTHHKHLGTVNAAVQHDGRFNIKFNEKALRFARKLEKRSYVRRQLYADLQPEKSKKRATQPAIAESHSIPRLNVAVHIVGSRGDVQPFIAIGKVLAKPPYNHRIRICTHPVFKDFVEENGLEFFSIGGDPAVLMAYMVKNPGLMPGMESLRAGDVGKRRADIAEILEGCWRSCVEAGDGMGGESKPKGAPPLTDPVDRLFVADAIIANPPSYAHIHCAEKLGVPLHMMFTMPWSPTQAFPHPLASFENAQADPNFSNYISYTMMELLAWQGLGDVINRFRTHTLNLDPISPLWGHMLLPRLKVPYTYTWSQALIPKPHDWDSHIDISGFAFLKSADDYKPPDDLKQFLDAGPPPVYIGFGSIVVDDPNKLTSMIFGAVKRAGVRALVSKGWGGIGGETSPEGVFLLGNVPHDWLFKYVSAVVHHGGAGTTAIGIAMGKPTVIVPFFGDQPFWGSMVYKAGAGPEPVPFKKMTEDTLYNSITAALAPEIQVNVKKMSEKIANEKGAEGAAKAFQSHLDIDSMRCLLCPDRVATWRIKKTNIRLSSLGAAVLGEYGHTDLSRLKLLRRRDWFVDAGPVGPASGIVAAFTTSFTVAIGGVSDYIRNISVIKHKDSKSDRTPSPERERRLSLTKIESNNPVSQAANYSPEHIAEIAYKMAAKSIPATAEERRKRREQLEKEYQQGQKDPAANGVKPGRTMSRNKALFSGTKKKHSKAHDAAIETGHFVDNMLEVGLKVPVAFFYNIANGFHNIPSFLLDDHTVRRRDDITGLGSGLKVAGKEFGLSTFEAISGIVVLPYKGAEESGAKGFGKGMLAGIGGIPFKAGAAVFALPGYSLKGVERQLGKRKDRPLRAKILQVRLQQGIAAFKLADEDTKKIVLDRWKTLQAQANIT